MSLDPALSLLRQCADGPRYRPGLPSYCRKEKIIHAAVDLGWVTYSDGVVTMTDKGRRALDGEDRWRAMGGERADVRMYGLPIAPCPAPSSRR